MNNADVRRVSTSRDASETMDGFGIRLLLLIPLACAALAASTQGGIAVSYYAALFVSTLMAWCAISPHSYGDAFHPWGFPQAYLTYALASPWFFMLWTGRDLGNIPNEAVTGPAAQILILTIIGWLIGTILATQGQKPPRQRQVGQKGGGDTKIEQGRWQLSHYRAMRTAGILLFLASLVLKAIQAYVGRGRSYGQGQAGFDTFTTLTPVVEGVFAAAILLLCATAVPLGKKILTPLVIFGAGAYGAASMILLGSRSELIAPAVIILWFLSRRHRVSLGKLTLLGVAVILLFNWVGNYRSQGASGIFSEASSPLERSIIDTSSPFYVTHLLTQVVPSSYDYTLGSTYIESLKYILPGYLSRSLFGPPTDTASLLFRKIAGLTNSNSGLGFSLPSEAYLNFGLVGAIAIPLALAFILTKSFGATAASAKNLYSLVYPVAIAILPYGLRSDSLGQVKMLLYPLAIAAVAAVFAARRSSHEK